MSQPHLCGLSLYLVGHPGSDQREQVLEQTGVILSVQVRQGALLSDGSVWVLNTNTHTVTATVAATC